MHRTQSTPRRPLTAPDARAPDPLARLDPLADPIRRAACRDGIVRLTGAADRIASRPLGSADRVSRRLW